jgi:hypothetical protein
VKVGGGGRALAIVLLVSSSVCGPAQTVDRGAITLQPDGGRDAPVQDAPEGTGGIGGYSGSGGGDGGDDPDAAGGTGGSLPDADQPPPDGNLPPPDVSAPPDSPPANMDVGTEPAPELPLVQVSSGSPAASTDLTAQGTVDWRHWGYNSASASNRKRSVAGTITMALTQSTVVGRYIDRPVLFSWADGDPTAAVNQTPDGIVVGDMVGRGFEMRVVGNPARARTVRVYVGVWGARARMAITLAGQSGTIYADSSLTATHPGADRVYTVEFQPAVQSQALVLRWTVDSINQQFGNVTLQAVSVAE